MHTRLSVAVMGPRRAVAGAFYHKRNGGESNGEQRRLRHTAVPKQSFAAPACALTSCISGRAADPDHNS